MAQHGEQVLPCLRREAGGRLVEEQQGGVGRQRHRDLHFALFAIREGLDHRVDDRLEPELRRRRQAAGADRLALAKAAARSAAPGCPMTATSRFSPTVRSPKVTRSGTCGRSRGVRARTDASREISRPWYDTAPPRHETSPVIALNSVVLPAPLVPRVPCRSPSVERRGKRRPPRGAAETTAASVTRRNGARRGGARRCQLHDRVVARGRAHREEFVAGEPRVCVDALRHAHDLLREVAVRSLLHLGDDDVATAWRFSSSESGPVASRTSPSRARPGTSSARPDGRPSPVRSASSTALVLR